MSRIAVIKGDITKQHVDAIVNAANGYLLGGGGVDGAIHAAAGPSLREECRQLPFVGVHIRCKTGDAKITRGYDLPAKWVIHTVGPVWVGGHCNEEQLLSECYANSLLCALTVSAETIAFPSISTGAYLFPLDLAARIAHASVNGFLDGNTAIKQVLFVCWDEQDFEQHSYLLNHPSDHLGEVTNG